MIRCSVGATEQIDHRQWSELAMETTKTDDRTPRGQHARLEYTTSTLKQNGERHHGVVPSEDGAC
jgi:hypothetical protein